jgi:bifunctional UDP-N-acetylglucosamine pyrophosphorylase/glucosamine-1-phosphate N-acetyltransferase
VDSTFEHGSDAGPYAHVRGGAHVGTRAHIGTGTEVKNSRIGEGALLGHFGYVGDANLGARVNVGAGTITCNFDGVSKHQTTIGDDAFIGSDTLLVAPVNVGAGAITGAGAVVTRDVDPGATVVGVPARALERRTSSPDDVHKSGESR